MSMYIPIISDETTNLSPNSLKEIDVFISENKTSNYIVSGICGSKKALFTHMLTKHLYEKHKKEIAMVEHGEILLRNYDLSYKDNIVKIKQGDKRDVINKASSMVKNSVINFSILENKDDYEAYFSAAKVGVSAIGAHTIPSSKRDTCVNIEDTLIDLYSSYKCEEFEKNVIPNLKLVSFLNNISAIFITDFNSDLMDVVCIKEYLLLDKEKVNKALEVFIGDNGVKIDEKQVFKYISQEYAMKVENELDIPLL